MERICRVTSRDYNVQRVRLHQEPDDGMKGPTVGNVRCYRCVSTIKAHPNFGALDPPRFGVVREGEVEFKYQETSFDTA